MKNKNTIEEIQNRATIYQFFHNPYGTVRAGSYKPNYFDCVALVCDAIPTCYKALWRKLFELSWSMSIRSLLVFIAVLPFWFLIVLPLPFTYPLWGLFVWLRMRGERERQIERDAELDKLI